MQVILKNRILNAFGGFLILILLLSCVNGNVKKPRVLLITGGHDFETIEFFNLFESLSDFNVDTLSQPYANQYIGSRKARAYDVLVFYDSWQTISDAEKEAYLDLTDRGKGFLFLHHSLVSYQEWDEFSKIRGGRYHKSDPPDSLRNSWYKHDLDLLVNILDSANTITRGMKDFMIHDEGYGNIMVLDGVTPLLKTKDPGCAEIIAWTNKYKNSKVVYLMGGHDKFAYENENYIKLVRNSLNYLIRKD
jgi:type 1 glutamine amidotransferase